MVVLAAPTHALSLSRPESRADAVGKGADPTHLETGLREWLAPLEETMRATMTPPSIAVFDTRVRKARHFPGSAAGSAARLLRKAGFDVVEHASFFVEGVTGPVTPGERTRARAWGRDLGESLQRGSRDRDLRSGVVETSDPVGEPSGRAGSRA